TALGGKSGQRVHFPVTLMTCSCVCHHTAQSASRPFPSAVLLDRARDHSAVTKRGGLNQDASGYYYASVPPASPCVQRYTRRHEAYSRDLVRGQRCPPLARFPRAPPETFHPPG